MTSHIIYQKLMSSAFTSSWFPVVHPANPRLKAVSLQCFWNGISGTPAGTVKIYGTNDIKAETPVGTVYIEVPDNTDDAALIPLNPVYAQFRVKFSPNGITDGWLNAVVNYAMT